MLAVWWYMPLILEPRRLRQMGLYMFVARWSTELVPSLLRVHRKTLPM